MTSTPDRLIAVLAAIAAPALVLLVDHRVLTTDEATAIATAVGAAVAAWHGSAVVTGRATVGPVTAATTALTGAAVTVHAATANLADVANTLTPPAPVPVPPPVVGAGAAASDLMALADSLTAPEQPATDAPPQLAVVPTPQGGGSNG